MQTITNDNFGPLIAYLVPGATSLWGLGFVVPSIATLFSIDQAASPTIGGFLFLSIIAIAAGMTVSAVRWVLLDSVLRFSGVRLASLDFAMLSNRVEAYALLTDNHYRHYLYYGNMFVASGISYVCYRLTLRATDVGWVDTGWLVLEVIFFVASRDTLKKYYRRIEQLLSRSGNTVSGNAAA